MTKDFYRLVTNPNILRGTVQPQTYYFLRSIGDHHQPASKLGWLPVLQLLRDRLVCRLPPLSIPFTECWYIPSVPQRTALSRQVRGKLVETCDSFLLSSYVRLTALCCSNRRNKSQCNKASQNPSSERSLRGAQPRPKNLMSSGNPTST